MVKYIVEASQKRYAPSLVDMVKDKLGISLWDDNYSLQTYKPSYYDIVTDSVKWNFTLSRRYEEIDQDMIIRLRQLGAKYVKRRYGDVYFYLDTTEIESERSEITKKYDQEYEDFLGSTDISIYKPDDATLKKLSDYRDRGSSVNVKAIKSEDKLLRYYYASKLLDWKDLSSNILDELSYAYDDTVAAMDRIVKVDDKYTDRRNEIDTTLGIPTNGLFTFSDKARNHRDKPVTWVPKKLLKYFVDNEIPVLFDGRTPGSQYDRNGRQWSEVEHLVLYPDSDNPVNYKLVVHTDEGGNPSTYTGRYTEERTSITNIVQDIERLLK